MFFWLVVYCAVILTLDFSQAKCFYRKEEEEEKMPSMFAKCFVVLAVAGAAFMAYNSGHEKESPKIAPQMESISEKCVTEALEVNLKSDKDEEEEEEPEQEQEDQEQQEYDEEEEHDEEEEPEDRPQEENDAVGHATDYDQGSEITSLDDDGTNNCDEQVSESDASFDALDYEAAEESENAPPAAVIAPRINVIVSARYLDFQEKPEYRAQLKMQVERRRRVASENATKAKRRFVF